MNTSYFPISLLIGHCIGDYLLQNKWMAVNKSASSFKCLVHSLLYTSAVFICTYPFCNSLYWFVLIFLSHYPIDRYSLADKWLDLINGRSLKDFIVNGKSNIPEEFDKENYHVLRGGFTSVVYCMVDNTFHFIIMFYGYILFFSN